MKTVGGRIELLHSIGEGGCATVWLGRHRDTGALAAVKLLAAGAAPAEAASRFFREAEISARLTHRNLVRVHDYLHEPDGSAALVMEHLRGETLEVLVARRGTLSAPAAVACIVSVLRGIEHAHECGVIHRDVKPSNVFLAVEPDGFVVPKVLDFGVAKTLDEQSIVLTQHGLIVGTPAYMSPEQVRGEHVGVTSDLFSVGAMLYEMLTGELAFRASSPQGAMLAILHREVAPHALVPEALWPVLQRVLQKDPEARHQSATALREALEESVQYTEQMGAAALQALAPIVTELPELPPRVPSCASFSSRPPAFESIPPTPSGLAMAAAPRLHWTPRNKLWAALATGAAIALVGGSAMRRSAGPAPLAMRVVGVARSAPPPAPPPAPHHTPSTVEGALAVRTLVEDKRVATAAAPSAKPERISNVVSSAPAPRPATSGLAGVTARAGHVARTPGF